MTDSRNERGEEPLGSPLDPSKLDGHTVEELSDYLDRGRIPRNWSIEASPGSQNALAALSRLRSLAPQILEAEADARDTSDDSWITRILEQIGVQAHAGRDIPISHAHPTARLSISEGAVRALIRQCGDNLDGFIVEKTVLGGDVETPGSLIRVEVEVSLLADSDRNILIRSFHDAVVQSLRRNTQLRIEVVTVRVRNDDRTEEELS